MRIRLLLRAVALFMTVPTCFGQVPSPHIYYHPPSYFSMGYSFMAGSGNWGNLHGWLFSMAGNHNEWFGLAGEIGGSYGAFKSPGGSQHASGYSFLWGPRFTVRSDKRVMPFASGLTGVARGGPGVFHESQSGTKFVVQPGL